MPPLPPFSAHQLPFTLPLSRLKGQQWRNAGAAEGGKGERGNVGFARLGLFRDLVGGLERESGGVVREGKEDQ